MTMFGLAASFPEQDLALALFGQTFFRVFLYYLKFFVLLLLLFYSAWGLVGIPVLLLTEGFAWGGTAAMLFFSGDCGPAVAGLLILRILLRGLCGTLVGGCAVALLRPYGTPELHAGDAVRLTGLFMLLSALLTGIEKAAIWGIVNITVFGVW